MKRNLEAMKTRKGDLVWPRFVPVTTLNGAFALDDVVRPFLCRLAGCALVSMHYAKGVAASPIAAPLMLDSGGFAVLRPGSRVEEREGLGYVLTCEEDGSEGVQSPSAVLQRQEELAEIGFTLDLPIPPGTTGEDVELRMRLTLANAAWAVANRRRKDLKLFGGVVGETTQDYVTMASQMVRLGVDGIAIGGLVPRAADWSVVREIVAGVVAEAANLPVHVFGIGKPGRIRELFELGVTSCDSSSYVRAAAEGKIWGLGQVSKPDLPTKLHGALANLSRACGTVPLGMAVNTTWLAGVVSEEVQDED